jgi:hypothetical protein
VLEECIDIRLGATLALLSAISPAFPHSPSQSAPIVVAVLGSREIAAAPKSD